MCGKVLQKVNRLHKKMDPLFGDQIDKVPQMLGLPTVDELGTGMGGDPTINGVAVSKEKYAEYLQGQVSGSEAPDAPTEVDSGVLAARDDEKRRRLAAGGQGSTVLTGSSGVTGGANVGRKTLLGA